MGHQFTIDVDGAECVLAVDEHGMTVRLGAKVLHALSWSDLLEVAVPTSLSARLSFAGQDPLTLRFAARHDRDAFRPWAERRGAMGPQGVTAVRATGHHSVHPAVLPAAFAWPPQPQAAVPAGVARLPHRPPATPTIPMHTLPAIPGRELVESLGMVTAQSLMGRGTRADPASHYKGVVGGTPTSVEQSVDDAIRAAALDLSARARALGADAVVAVNLSTACVGDRAEAVILVGTAVRTVPVDRPT